MKVFDWLAKQFHVASGRKLVTYIGLAISSISSTCLLMGDEWLSKHIGDWSPRTCGAFIFIGGVVAAFGKGVGDRRVDPEKQAIDDTNLLEERRQTPDEKAADNG